MTFPISFSFFKLFTAVWIGANNVSLRWSVRIQHHVSFFKHSPVEAFKPSFHSRNGDVADWGGKSSSKCGVLYRRTLKPNQALTQHCYETLTSQSNLKERLYLVHKVEDDNGMIPAHVAKELYGSRTWTSDWLARYHKEGIPGLENRPKSGSLPNYLKKLLLRWKKLKERKQGCTTQQVDEIDNKRRRSILPSGLYLYIAS